MRLLYLSIYFSDNLVLLLLNFKTDSLFIVTSVIWHPENETQQSSVFVVHSGTAMTNPTDSTFNFNSRWILLIWRELQLALTTNVLQGVSFYSDTLRLSTFESSITFTGVESVLLLQLFYTNICPSTITAWRRYISVSHSKTSEIRNWKMWFYFCHYFLWIIYSRRSFNSNLYFKHEDSVLSFP